MAPRPHPSPPSAPHRDPPAETSSAPSPSAGLAQVALIVLGEQPLGQVLEHVAKVTAATVPGAGEVSVTLVEGSRARSAGFSGPVAAALDERQHSQGFGPCLDAARTGSVVIVFDTADCTAYPDFAALAVRHGVTSVLSGGMPMLGKSIGALTIYCTSGSLAASSSDLGRVFAASASVALSNALVVAQATDSVTQMREAMTSRAGIEQAKGILMAQQGVGADEAFEQLARRSQLENRKVRDVAGDVVRAAAGPAPELV